jgi:hypothetical protein
MQFGRLWGKDENENMTDFEVDETGQQFMIRLFEQTRGDPSVQVSMYDIGGLLGLERGAASKVAESLMGLQLVEIRTLSGGIGISATGSEMVQNLIGPIATDAGASIKLGDERVLSSAARQAVEQVVAEVKDQTGSLGLDFDTLTELMADLKTIDAQLGSSRAKTAIVRECLRSMAALAKHSAGSALYGRLRAMLED